MQKIEKNFNFHGFLFSGISVLSGDPLPQNNLLQLPGHAVHELGLVHLDDPEPLDLLDPLIT
jgi:hypothetical protein